MRMIDHGAWLAAGACDLHTLLFAGEPFPVKHVRLLRERFPTLRMFNLYGPTETNVCAAFEVKQIDPQRVHPMPIGRAVCGDSLSVRRSDGQEAGAGESGELIVRGPTLMNGYWGHPAPTTGFHATGDRVRRLADGNLEYVGRLDQMLKVRGYRVEPGEVEAALLAHHRIRAAAVTAARSSEGMVLIAFVLADHPQPGVVALKQHCAGLLPRYMIPHRFRFVDAMPQTANGKLDRTALGRWAEACLPAQRGDGDEPH
jgi:acyl-coenzyme A synthetase/AMP-(fatty) acid ligase